MPEDTRQIPLSRDINAPLEGNPDATQEQNDDEIKVVKLVERLYSEAKERAEKYHSNWLENYKAFIGDMWQQKRPTYRHSEVLNLIFSEVHSVLPLLTDIRPNVEAIPQEPSDFEFAQVVSEIIENTWDADLASHTLAEAIIDMSIYGTAIAQVPWDDKADDGLGNFSLQTIDPFTFYPDPYARDINHKTCGYVVVAEPVDPAVLKSQYPDKAKLIKADMGDLSLVRQGRDVNSMQDDLRFRSPVDRRTLVQDPQFTTPEKSAETVLKLTCLYKDGTVIQNKFTDSEGKEKDENVLAYPMGRKVVTASGVLLEDGPMEIELFDYARLVDYAMPREFWGKGEVDTQLTSNRIINKLISYMLDVMVIMGNPVWVISTDSEVDADELVNAPGLVVEKAPNSEVRRESGVQLQPYIFQTLQYFIDNVQDKLSGINDATRGAGFAGQSGIAIDQLQEAAQTKIRQKSRNVETFLTQVGEIMFRWIMKKYTAPRVVRITGNENDAKYFRVQVNQDEEGNPQGLTIQESTGNGEFGTPKEFSVKGRVDIKLKTGTQLPIQKARRANLAKELYQLGVIDEERLLKDLDYPNRDEVLAKLEQKKAALAAAQAQQIAAGGVPNANGSNGQNAPQIPGAAGP